MTPQDQVKFDLHTHHDRCGHAEGSISDYIESAIEKGLHYIGISDHSPHFYSEDDHLYPGITMPISEFQSYVQEVLELKEKYKDKIHVLLGMESDFFPEHHTFYTEQIEKYPFDYVIGSIHYVNEINIFQKGRWEGLSDEEQIHTKEEYYRLIQESARSGSFQILGHIDAMKGFYPEFSTIPTDTVDETLRVISECNVAIEVNTSGKTKYCGGWYPSDELLERANFYGVDITFGSDSHVATRIADDFDEVKKKLKQIGFKEMVYFVERKRRAVQL